MISDIALTAHSHTGRSCSRVCAMWSAAVPHPVLHIPLMWNMGQALQLGSTGDTGRSTPARLALRVIIASPLSAGKGPTFPPRRCYCTPWHSGAPGLPHRRLPCTRFCGLGFLRLPAHCSIYPVLHFGSASPLLRRPLLWVRPRCPMAAIWLGRSVHGLDVC